MRERRVKGDGSVYDRRRRGGARIEASIRSRSPTSVNINRSVSFAPLALAIALVAGCGGAPPLRTPDSEYSLPAREAVEMPAWDGSGGASNMRSRGEALADFALRLRGSPYRYGGATIDGFDCSGLVFYAHRALGLTVPRTSRDQADDSTDVKAKKLRPGDLVFFKIDSRRVNHVGIYVGDHRFVHAPGKGKPVTTNSLNDEFYAKRFFSAGRYWNRLPQ
jgi:cell wall-associated NlpC family hydrolase